MTKLLRTLVFLCYLVSQLAVALKCTPFYQRPQLVSIRSERRNGGVKWLDITRNGALVYQGRVRKKFKSCQDIDGEHFDSQRFFLKKRNFCLGVDSRGILEVYKVRSFHRLFATNYHRLSGKRLLQQNEILESQKRSRRQRNSSRLLRRVDPTMLASWSPKSSSEGL